MRSPGAHRTLRISIHAPRTGSDKGPRSDGGADDDFNPRSPHGERPWDNGSPAAHPISIHAPRTGSDARFIAI